MNRFHVAETLALKLTTETGSCQGILTLYDVKPAQTALFGTVLVPGQRNTIIVKGVDETVVSLDRKLVFGRQVRATPVVTPWRDLGDE